MAGPSVLIMLLAALVAIPIAVLLVIYVLVPIFKGIGWFIRQIFRFIAGEIGDFLRLIGALITAVVFIPLVLLNIVIGRWSAASHFGRAIQGELTSAGAAVYRIAIGHPARLLCLTALTEGIEKRIPEVVAAAPGRDRPARARTQQFEGYEIVGSLKGGGSGGRLYVARPDAMKLASLERSGHADVDLCVIKAFNLQDGSSLPQIVRESRALDAAKKMGLVVEHSLTDEQFFYVMRYVPGDSLAIVTQRLHAESSAGGLGDRQLGLAVSYVTDLVRTLDAYHKGGLWHKDVKPDNIIVDGKRAHLVDLGLITPLRSALTLTTHGTEYFRDPELVRLALRGVKVHQVDGAKFDIYAAGAVLYSVIENSFPAHGGLSQIEKRCPEALKWVIRRSMTEYDKRYPTAALLLADLEAIGGASDPFALRPADLPSMKGVPPPEPEEPVAAANIDDGSGRAVPVPPPIPQDAPKPERVGVESRGTPRPRSRPRITVTNWWTGRYEADRVPGDEPKPADDAGVFIAGIGAGTGDPFAGYKRARSARQARSAGPEAPATPNLRGHPLGLTAQEQVERARARAQSARQRAQERMSSHSHRRAHTKSPSGINVGVGLAVVIGLLAVVGGVALLAPVTAFVSAESKAARRRAAAAEQVQSVIAAAPDPAMLLLQRLHGELADKRIVVIKDAELSERGDATVRRAISSLQTIGVRVDGDYTADPGAVLGDELIDVMAKAREVRGLAPVDSDDATIALANWLDDSAAADIVLWVTRASPDEPDTPAYHAVGRAHDSSAILAGYLRAVAAMTSSAPAGAPQGPSHPEPPAQPDDPY